MSFSIQDVEKFIGERPSLALKKEEMIFKAKLISGGGTIIVDKGAEIIFGKELSEEFFSVLESDTEHIRIGMEDLDGSNV